MCLLADLEKAAVLRHQICHLLMTSRWSSSFTSELHDSHAVCKSKLVFNCKGEVDIHAASPFDAFGVY